MKQFIYRIKNSQVIRNINYWSLIVFFALYIFSIPSFGAKSPTNYITYGLISITAVLVALYYVFYKKPQFNLATIVLPLFVFFALIGTVIFSHSYRSWLTLLLLLLSFYVFYFMFDIFQNKFLIIFLAILALFSFSLYFIYHYRVELLNFKSYKNDSFRLGTYFDNQNGVSSYSVVGFSFSLYFILFYSKKIKYFCIVPLLSILVVGLSTGSKTFVLAIALITILMLFFKFKKKKLLFVGILVLLIIIFSVLINLPFMATLKYRFLRALGTFFGSGSRVDTSSLSRAVWLDYGFYLGNKNLLTGLGADGFRTFSGVPSYTHSNFSEVWCDFGLIGFVLFYASLVMSIYMVIRYKNKNISFVLPFVLYYFLISFSNVFYYNKIYYFVLSFIFYLSFNEKNIKQVKIENIFDYVKHIVFTCDGLESGGAEKVIATLSNEFNRQGYKVTIVGVSTHKTDSFYELDNDISYITLHNGAYKKINAIKRVLLLHKVFKNIKPDVVISFLPHVNIYTYFSLYGLNVPLIVSERNDPRLDPKGPVLRILKKYVFNQADGCVFQTNAARDYFSSIVKKKSTVIDNPLQLTSNPRFDLSKNDKTIISVGRLTAQKNFPCLIEAFELFAQKHSDYILKIYGTGEEKNNLLTIIENKGLDNSIKLMGNSSEWHSLEKNASLFVLTSNFEGMPNALAEAIALGIPVVSTDSQNGGPRELIKNGINGYLCKLNDPIDISCKMEMALELKIGEKDVSTFVSEKTPKVVASKWINFIKIVYERVLSE